MVNYITAPKLNAPDLKCKSKVLSFNNPLPVLNKQVVFYKKFVAFLLRNLLFLASCLGMFVNSYASPQVGDAICSNQPIPAGWAPIEALQSPECDTVEPFKSNAWILDKLTDGIVSCLPPNYDVDPAPNISYVVYKRVHTQKCPTRLDGTPNGYFLRHWSASVISAKDSKKMGCNGIIIGGICQEKATEDIKDEYPEDSGWFESNPADSGGWVVKVEVTEYKQFRVIRGRIASEYWPVCLSTYRGFFRMFNPTPPAWNIREKFQLAKTGQYSGELLLLSRVFFDPICPTSELYGPFNAAIIHKVSVPSIAGVKFWNCADSKYPAEIIQYPNAFHTDACGVDAGVGKDRVNAYRVE